MSRRSPRSPSAAEAAKGTGTTIIADGGIRFSGDITKAIAAGADLVMIGGLLAGLDESPGERILYQGRTYKSLSRHGFAGGHGASGSSERYRQSGHVTTRRASSSPKGSRGGFPTRGSSTRSSTNWWADCGPAWVTAEPRTIDELRTEARFIRVSPATVRENHPHDIAITQEAPNYTAEHLGHESS